MATINELMVTVGVDADDLESGTSGAASSVEASFDQIIAAAGLTDDAFTQTAGLAADLGSSMDDLGGTASSLEGDVDGVAGAFDTAAGGVEGLGDGFDSVAGSAESLDGSVAGSAESLDSLGSSAGDMAGDMSTAADSIEEVSDSGGGLLDQVDGVAVALAGAGAAAEGFAQGQQDTNAALARLELTTGTSAESLRDSADEMTNWTFSMDDAVAGMERLTQKGITQQDQFEELLPVFDDLADATGNDLVAGIDTAQALLGPFGEGIEDIGENVDQMARLMTQTDVPLGSLSRNLARVPDELQDLEFGLDEAAAGVQVFRDRGFEGKEAIREFRRAVEDSEGDMSEFLDVLGIGEGQWHDYVTAVEPASGLASDFAAANNEVTTPMERMQANFENMLVTLGPFAEILGTLAPILIALAVAKQAYTSAAVVATAAQAAFNLVMAANPIVLVVLAIAGLIAILVALGVDLDDVKEIAGVAFDFIKNVASSAFDWFKDNWPLLAAILTGPFGLALLVITRNWDKIKDGASAVKDGIVNRFNDLVGFISRLPGRVSGAASGMFQGIADAFKGPLNTIIGWWNGISFTLPTINIPSADIPGLGSIGGGSIGGQTFSTPNIPALARGGVADGLSLVGELGPELVDFPPGSRVHSNRRTEAMLDRMAAEEGGTGRPVVINVEGSIRSDQDLIALIRDELNEGGLRGAIR